MTASGECEMVLSASLFNSTKNPLLFTLNTIEWQGDKVIEQLSLPVYNQYYGLPGLLIS